MNLTHVLERQWIPLVYCVVILGRRSVVAPLWMGVVESAKEEVEEGMPEKTIGYPSRHQCYYIRGFRTLPRRWGSRMDHYMIACWNSFAVSVTDPWGNHFR